MYLLKAIYPIPARRTIHFYKDKNLKLKNFSYYYYLPLLSELESNKQGGRYNPRDVGDISESYNFVFVLTNDK